MAFRYVILSILFVVLCSTVIGFVVSKITQLLHRNLSLLTSVSVGFVIYLIIGIGMFLYSKAHIAGDLGNFYNPSSFNMIFAILMWPGKFFVRTIPL